MRNKKGGQYELASYLKYIYVNFNRILLPLLLPLQQELHSDY
jgi:hypothetical protein